MPKIKGKYTLPISVLFINKTIGGIPVKDLHRTNAPNIYYNGEITGKIWVEPANCWMTRAWTKEGKATFQPNEVTDYDILIPPHLIPE